MSIEITQLGFSYGRTPVLRNITARAQSGRITAVLGPNAAGKSTLLRCVIGALRPSRGSVRIDNEDVHVLSARALARRISYVPQRPVVAAAFSVRQVIELGRFALPADDAQINSAIAEMELADLQGRAYPMLSVGQQQRVTVARALAQLSRNGCLVLDEPTSAMDLRHLKLTFDILKTRARQGATILIAMHDLSLAAAVAEDVWVLNGGELSVAGPVEDALTLKRLREVFGVEFEWLRSDTGELRLVSNLDVVSNSARISLP